MRAELAIKRYWELKGEAIEALLLSRGSSTKMLSKFTQTHGSPNDIHDVKVAQKSNAQPQNLPDLFFSSETIEHCNSRLKKSSANRLSQLSWQLWIVGQGLRTFLPAPAHLRMYKLYALLDELAKMQESLRSSLRHQVLER